MAINKITCGVSTGSELADSINRLVDASTSSKSNVVIFGDSITEQNNSTSGVVDNINIDGYFSVANLILNNKFKLVNNAGVGGNTVAAMLARMQNDVFSFNPDICVVLGGTNDLLSGLPVLDAIANLTSIYELLLINGVSPVLCTVPSANGFVSEDDWHTLNNFISTYAYDNNLRIVDFASSIMTHTNQIFPYHVIGATKDGTHPTKIGANLMGVSLAAVLLDIKGVELPVITTNSNQSNIIRNTLLNGTSGSVPSGVAPDDWFSNSGANPDVTYTGIIVSEQQSNIYKVDITNIGVSLGNISMRMISSNGFSDFDNIRVLAEIGMENGNGVEEFEFRVTIKNSSNLTTKAFTFLANDSASFSIDGYNLSGRVILPIINLPIDTSTVEISLRTTCISGTLSIKNPEILVV